MADFLKANYHTHTFRCQHADGTEREYIEAAIELGIKILGFSDHIPCDFKDGYVSRIRMTMDQAPDYVDVIRKLAEEYKEDIRIFVGFEAEFIPEFFDGQIHMARELGIDYLIMGQHFWTAENTGPYAGSANYDDERIRCYVDSVIRGMKTGKYLYLAHPDLMNYQGMDSVYETEMERLCKAMKKLGVPLEINMLGMEERRNYPNPKFWRIAGEVGNDVVLGLDAHSVDHIYAQEIYDRCMMNLVERFDLHLLDELNVTEHGFF